MTSTPPPLAQCLRSIIDPLRKAVASRAGQDRTLAPMVLLLWSYLHRLTARFEGLAKRLQQGRFAPVRAPRPGRIAPIARSPRLPRGFAWLLRRVPETSAFGGQLRHLLTRADMAQMLATSPQAAKILRPLCRMLGVEPAPDIPPELFLRPDTPRPRAAPELHPETPLWPPPNHPVPA